MQPGGGAQEGEPGAEEHLGGVVKLEDGPYPEDAVRNYKRGGAEVGGPYLRDRHRVQDGAGVVAGDLLLYLQGGEPGAGGHPEGGAGAGLLDAT